MRWPLTVYEVVISDEEKFERIMNEAARREVSRCLSEALYGKFILKLPITSLVEEFKCAKPNSEMTISV